MILMMVKSVARSFIDGMARTLDIGAVRSPFYGRFRAPYTGPEADARALAHDWQMVGNDIRRASKRLRAEIAAAESP